MAQNYFEETQENYIEKLDHFHKHLVQYQNNNTNERNSRLLYNIPSLELVHPSSIYKNVRYFEEGFEQPVDDNDKCPPQIRKFLLKFLRGGNHNVESATTLLLAYLQMMNDHPKYYDGLINPGSFIRL